MFCTNCGTEVNDGSKFCPVCGNDLQAQNNAQGVAGEAAEDTAAIVNEAAESAEAAVNTVDGAASAEDAGAAIAEETADNAAEGAGTVDTAASENIPEAGVNTSGVAAGFAAGAAVVGNAVSDMTEAAVQPEGEAVSGSDALGNVTAQYAKRIEEQKAAYSGSYTGNQSAQNNQYGAQQGQFNGQNSQYGAQQGRFNGQNSQYGAQQGQFNGQNSQYGAQQGRFSGETAQFNSQHSQFNQGQANNGFNGAPYGNQQFNTAAAQPKSGIVTAGMVLCIIALVLSFFQIFYVLGGVFGIFGGIGDEGFFGFIFGVISFVLHVIKLCGLLGSALIMYLIWKKWDDSKAEPLMAGALTGGLTVILTVVLRAIFTAVFNGVIFGYTYAGMFSGAFLSVVFAIAMMVATYVLINEKKINPIAGLQGGNPGDVLKNDLKAVYDMAMEAKDEFQSGKNGSANAGAYSNVNQNAGYGNPVNGQPQPNNFGGGMLSTDRSIVAYILLGLVTCGIYDLYMLHCIIQDVNITCAGDGKKTAGILEYILFGILTCGIYDYIWLYNLGNRLQNNAPRYGMNFQEGGTTILLWWIFGAFLCGVGPFVAANIIIKNSNALNAAYNNMAAQQNGNF